MSDELTFESVKAMIEPLSVKEVHELLENDARLKEWIRFDSPAETGSFEAAAADCPFKIYKPGQGWVCP